MEDERWGGSDAKGAEEDEMEEEAGKRKGGVAMEATAVDDPRSAAK